MSVSGPIRFFCISLIGSVDIFIALALNAIFTTLTQHLFNEESALCIIPSKYRNYEHLLDLDGDNEVTKEELKKARQVLEKVRKRNERREHLRNLNNFKSLV